MQVWFMMVFLLQVVGTTTLGKYPYQIHYQLQDFQGDTPVQIRGTLWVLGSLCKSVRVYPDGITQIELYDGSQWWLYLSNAPYVTPSDHPPLRSVLEFFVGKEIPLTSETGEIPCKNGKILLKGVRQIPGLGPVPEQVIQVNAQGKPVWKIIVTSIKEAPEITEDFFQKSNLPSPGNVELKARDKDKNPVWDY